MVCPIRKRNIFLTSFEKTDLLSRLPKPFLNPLTQKVTTYYKKRKQDIVWFGGGGDSIGLNINQILIGIN